MRKYLLTIAYKTDAKRSEVMEELKPILEELHGKIESEEDLPAKRLAYEIQKTRDASFQMITLSGDPELPARLSEALRINDYVLRYLITTLEEVKTK